LKQSQRRQSQLACPAAQRLRPKTRTRYTPSRTFAVMDKRRGPAKALSLSLSLSLFASAHPRNRVLITTRKNTHYTTYIRQVLKRKSKRACRFRVSPKSSTTNPKCRCALGFRLNLHPQLETLSAQTGVQAITSLPAAAASCPSLQDTFVVQLPAL